MGERMLDWTQPIQFENGEPAELIGTLPDGTREVRRVGGIGMSSVWWFKEDGLSDWPGYNLVNKPSGGDR